MNKKGRALTCEDEEKLSTALIILPAMRWLPASISILLKCGKNEKNLLRLRRTTTSEIFGITLRYYILERDNFSRTD